MLLKPKPIVDQSFDNRAEFFKKQIYGTSKGKIRAAVVWRDLEEILTKFPNGKSLKILDVGGGFGFMAQKLAALGHNVTVVDISSDMITLGKKELENLELSGTIDFIQGACQDILSIVGESCKDDKYTDWTENNIALVKRIRNTMLKIFIPFLTLGVFLPDSKQAAIIFSVGQTIEYVKGNEKLKELPDKAVMCLDKFISEYLEEKPVSNDTCN